MTSPFLGEIKMFAGNFAPRGYATCDGQIVSIASGTALFALIGTYYGGNGSTTYALPNMQSRTPIAQFQGAGLSNYSIGQQGGVENVTLTTPQMPAHTHQLSGGITPGAPTQNTGMPGNTAVFTNSSPGAVWINSATSLIAIAAQSVSITGGGQAHPNRQPTCCILFIIATQGVFPQRN